MPIASPVVVDSFYKLCEVMGAGACNTLIKLVSEGRLATFFGQPSYGATFNTFSTARLFTPINSNIVDATFFIPGTNGGRPLW